MRCPTWLSPGSLSIRQRSNSNSSSSSTSIRDRKAGPRRSWDPLSHPCPCPRPQGAAPTRTPAVWTRPCLWRNRGDERDFFLKHRHQTEQCSPTVYHWRLVDFAHSPTVGTTAVWRVRRQSSSCSPAKKPASWSETVNPTTASTLSPSSEYKWEVHHPAPQAKFTVSVGFHSLAWKGVKIWRTTE